MASDLDLKTDCFIVAISSHLELPTNYFRVIH